MSARKSPARVAEMARLYSEEGLTLIEVGQRFGVSGPRVAQLLKPLGVRRPPALPRSGPNPSGLCMCGCGERTALAKGSSAPDVAGKPRRYLVGHHARKSLVRYVVEDRGHTTPCWIWQGAHVRFGHGTITVAQKPMLAHRYFYEQAKGPIPAGLQLDHLCRVPPCVNPDHVEPVTHAENIRRGASAKLSPASVAEIKALFGAGYTRSEIARAYGVGETTIRNIYSGLRWSDITPADRAPELRLVA